MSVVPTQSVEALDEDCQLVRLNVVDGEDDRLLVRYEHVVNLVGGLRVVGEILLEQQPRWVPKSVSATGPHHAVGVSLCVRHKYPY